MQVDPEEINRPWNSHRGLASPPARCFQSIWQPARLGKPSDLSSGFQGRFDPPSRKHLFRPCPHSNPFQEPGRSMQRNLGDRSRLVARRVRKFFDPSRQLLRHLRGYQKRKKSGQADALAVLRLAPSLVSRVERRDRGGNRSRDANRRGPADSASQWNRDSSGRDHRAQLLDLSTGDAGGGRTIAGCPTLGGHVDVGAGAKFWEA